MSKAYITKVFRIEDNSVAGYIEVVQDIDPLMLRIVSKDDDGTALSYVDLTKEQAELVIVAITELTE